MANRDNHYEAAFEAWLRQLQIPYVAVDETKRSLFGGGSLKSLDFIVSPADEQAPVAGEDPAAGEDPTAGARNLRWLVDVKGRKFPGGEQQAQYWKNWSTHDDLWSLGQWEQLFGEQFRGLFVFAYLVTGTRAPLPQQMLFDFRDQTYGFVAISLAEYARWARPVSTAWNTVAMPTAPFRQLARPMESLLRAS